MIKTADRQKQHTKRYRIAFINTHPIQYFAPLYRYLNETGIFDISALYLTDVSLRGATDRGFRLAVKWDIDLLSGYRAKFMGEAARRRVPGRFFSLVGPELWNEIRSRRYDAIVIYGHNYAAHYLALAAAKFSGTKVMMRGETHLNLQRKWWKQWIRTPIIRRVYQQFDAFLAIGSDNRDYYKSFGVPVTKIYLVPYAVDNSRFIEASSVLPEERKLVRARLGVHDERPIILFAGKFETRKRPDDLMRAYGLLSRSGLGAHLVLVGSGEMESRLFSLATSLCLRDVHFPGFINQAELPKVYAACDVFVLPSVNEPWGLAVNEAMCAGLPVVVSKNIGCARDLVAHGLNGCTFEAGNVAALAEALLEIVGNRATMLKMGRASVDRIREWSFAECSEGLLHAVGSSAPPDALLR